LPCYHEKQSREIYLFFLKERSGPFESIYGEEYLSENYFEEKLSEFESSIEHFKLMFKIK